MWKAGFSTGTPKPAANARRACESFEADAADRRRIRRNVTNVDWSVDRPSPPP
jgi:hypothetical protein